MLKELFKKLHGEGPTQNIDVSVNNPSQYPTRWNFKGLLPSKNKRAVIKKESLENTLKKLTPG